VSKEEELENKLKLVLAQMDALQKRFDEQRHQERRDSSSGTFLRRFTRNSEEAPPSYDNVALQEQSQGQLESDQQSQEIGDDPIPPIPKKKKTVFIKRVELSLNGSPIGEKLINSFRPC